MREEPGNDRIEKDASVCRALFWAEDLKKGDEKYA